MQLKTPSHKHKVNFTTIPIENADTRLAYITKPQELEYKKVAKPSFQRELRKHLYCFPNELCNTVCLQTTANETREESKPAVLL